MQQPRNDAETREWVKEKMVTLVSGFLGAKPTKSQQGNISIYEWRDWHMQIKVEPTEDRKGIVYGVEMKNLPNNVGVAFPKIYELVFEIVDTVLGGGKSRRR